MSSLLDPYRALQILPDAEQEVIQAAFRALALKYHPDRDRSARAAQRMRELNQLSRHSSGIRFRTEIYQILGRQGMPAA